jgi:rhodanese-related sulfurtransferase
MTAKIGREELKGKLDRGEAVTIVEALPEEYYRKAHLPGALLLPHDRVDELAPALLPDKGAEIVVYCANLPCQNSEIAAERLTELGYGNVREYAEGKQDWIDAGYATERGVPLAAAA